MPLTMREHEKSLRGPALCELLPVRDYLDNVVIRTDGSLVAGYQLKGLTTYFAGDEERNRSKLMLESLLRSVPEQSMRLQIRYETVEDLGGLLDRYTDLQDAADSFASTLDDTRIERWAKKEQDGYYSRPLIHAYFIWNPDVHHRVTGKGSKNGQSHVPRLTLSTAKSIQRSRALHNEILAEFESLLGGVEATMHAAQLGACRMSDSELFHETKRALNPLSVDDHLYRRGEEQLLYRSAREQIADVSIVDETDTYLNVDGLLYSFVSLKELPDATYPGILRELIALDFPITVNATVSIPDQTKVLKGYKTRLRKMQAAQRDSHGGYKVNVEAQVAESQLFKVQQEIIASSVKTAKLSLVIGTRTSQPAITASDLESAERTISNRRQQLLYAIARMNGGKAVTETYAKRRMFFSCLPAMGGEDLRDQDLLTPNAADLLPVEAPWQGTPRSPLFLLETPYRQLIPFSSFDPGLTDSNMLIMSKTGGGKTLMVQQLLLMASRVDPLISILERGSSYRQLIELMGGQMITMSLEADHTINPWDLPAGEREPGKDQIAFLKNLTRHMLGDSTEDPDLLDNLITDAIQRTYKRAAIRPSNSIPTFSDLRDELAQWRDEEKNQRVMEAAQLAAIKLRSWTGEKGIYSKLFDRPTTVPMDSPWLYFNIEHLSSDPRLETAMSLLIAHATVQRASGKSGRRSITVLDECWAILRSAVLAPVVVQLYRTARKRNGAIWGISQTTEDFVGSQTDPIAHGPGILKNCTTKIIGQQPGDSTALREHLHLNPTAINQIKHLSPPVKGKSSEALIVIGEKAETTHIIRIAPTPVDYWITTTYPRERVYRAWWLNQQKDTPLLEAYRKLADKFPAGLADVEPLTEEISGEVMKGVMEL